MSATATVPPPSGIRHLRPAPMIPQYKVAATPLNPRQTRLSSPRQRVIKPEYVANLFNPGVGTTWFRMIPPHVDSVVDHWLYEFRVYDLAPRSAGFIPEIAVPSSLYGAAPVTDRIEIFSNFIENNYPHLKQQRGYMGAAPVAIWGRDRGICAIRTIRTSTGAEDDQPLRFWYGSTYVGNRSLRPGVLRSLCDICYSPVPSFDGSKQRARSGDISHPETGRLVSITLERNGADSLGGIAVDERTAPINALARVYATHPLFNRVNIPIEQVVHCPTEQELTEVLENYLGWQVRNGYATEEVYEAYARCFGHDVDPSRRVTAPARVSVVDREAQPVASPEVREAVSPATVASTAAVAVKPCSSGTPRRMVDDLDEAFPTVPAAQPVMEAPSTTAAALPALNAAPITPVPTDLGLGAANAVAAPASPSEADLVIAIDPRTASQDDLLAVLLNAKKTPAIVRMNPDMIRQIRFRLVFRFLKTLRPADHELINSFAPDTPVA